MTHYNDDGLMGRGTRLLAVLCLLALLPLATYGQQRWWGYYADSAQPSYMGTQTAETYTCGAQFFASRTVLNGATIHGVRFCLRNKSNISDVKVWLSTTQPASADAADIMVVSVPQEQLADFDADRQMTEVTLPETYSFSGRNIYVGYSFKVGSAKTEADRLPVVCAGKGNGTAGNFWIRTTKTLLSWNDMSSRNGALALQLLVSNPSLTADAVEPDGLDRLVGVAGAEASADVMLTAVGLNEVRSIDYVVTVGTRQMVECHYDLPVAIWTPGHTAVVPVSFDLPAATGATDYAVRVTRVNGNSNAATQPLTSGQLIVVDQLGHRRSVVEEYTGTWCVNCPRGIVGMSNLHRQFADDFIGIAVHTNNGATKDPMYLAAYSPLIPPAVPRCQIDRALWCDPYMGLVTDYHYHLDDAYRLMLSRPTEADLTLEARWTDEARTQLQLTAHPTFYFDGSGDDYALAFVVLADSLCGTTKEWWQANGEAGSKTYPDSDMDRFRNASDPVKDIVFDHVPIAAQGIADGISGSVEQSLVSGVEQSFTATFDLSQNTLVQDKDRLSAVALLLSRSSGQVVNAAMSAVGSGAGVHAVEGLTARPASWFTADGRRVASPSRPGIYIKNNKKLIIK